MSCRCCCWCCLSPAPPPRQLLNDLEGWIPRQSPFLPHPTASVAGECKSIVDTRVGGSGNCAISSVIVRINRSSRSVDASRSDDDSRALNRSVWGISPEQLSSSLPAPSFLPPLLSRLEISCSDDTGVARSRGNSSSNTAVLCETDAAL